MHLPPERTERYPHLMHRLRTFPVDLLVLFPILAVGSLLRFAALPQRGLIYWDEGKFSLEGLRLLGAVSRLAGSPSLALSGKAIGTAKPTHALLIAVAYALVGVHDYAPLMLSAAMSVGQVALLYVVGRRLFGPTVALVAALFLAVSGYDVAYARSALSEGDANLLFLAGFSLWTRTLLTSNRPLAGPGPKSIRLLSGLLLGLSFTANYRLIVYIAVLVALDLARVARGNGWRAAVTGLLLWCTGIAILPLAWEAVDLLARAHGLILFRSEATHLPTSYLGEVLYQLHGGKQAALHLNLSLYIQWYLVRQGWPMFLLLLGGLGLAAARRTALWVVPAALVVGPYLIFSCAPFIVPRNLDATLPFSSLLAAAALVSLVRAMRSYQLLTLLAGVVLLALTVYDGTLAWRLTAERSGYVQAVAYVHRHGSENALVVNEVLRFYLRDKGTSCDAPTLPGSLSVLAAADGFGDRYVILDRFGSPLARYLISHARPVARYVAAGSLSLGENPIASENGYAPGDGRTRYINVYTLDSFHLARSDLRAPPACSLDRVA